MEHQPDEEPATWWGPGFPNSLPWTELDGSQKESLISRLAAIGTMLS